MALGREDAPTRGYFLTCFARLHTDITRGVFIIIIFIAITTLLKFTIS